MHFNINISLYSVILPIFDKTMPEIIEPVFAKTSPKCSFSMTENERFGRVFANTGSIFYKFGQRKDPEFDPDSDRLSSITDPDREVNSLIQD